MRAGRAYVVSQGQWPQRILRIEQMVVGQDPWSTSQTMRRIGTPNAIYRDPWILGISILEYGYHRDMVYDH